MFPVRGSAEPTCSGRALGRADPAPMSKLEDQISALLPPGEPPLAVSQVRLVDNVALAGVVAGGLVGHLVVSIARDIRGKRRANAMLAHRLGHRLDRAYVAVTPQRLIVFGPQRFKIHSPGEIHAEFSRREVSAANPTIRRFVDSTVEFAFVDGSSVSLRWRRSQEVAPWMEGFEQFMAGAPVGLSGYVEYLPSTAPWPAAVPESVCPDAWEPQKSTGMVGFR